jgi:hypothetical protein
MIDYFPGVKVFRLKKGGIEIFEGDPGEKCVECPVQKSVGGGGACTYFSTPEASFGSRRFSVEIIRPDKYMKIKFKHFR